MGSKLESRSGQTRARNFEHSSTQERLGFSLASRCGECCGRAARHLKRITKPGGERTKIGEQPCFRAGFSYRERQQGVPPCDQALYGAPLLPEGGPSTVTAPHRIRGNDKDIFVDSIPKQFGQFGGHTAV